MIGRVEQTVMNRMHGPDLTKKVFSCINTIIMGQTLLEVMQSISNFGLDAAKAFSAQAPESHLIITASSPSNPSPLVADGTELYASTEAVEQALPTAREALYEEIRACFPAILSEGDEELIQKQVLDTLHVVYRDVGQHYRMPTAIDQVLIHEHELAVPPSYRIQLTEFR